MSAEVGSILFYVTQFASADLIEASSRKFQLTLRDEDVRNKTASSKILDSTILTIQRIVTARLRLDPNKTGVIFLTLGLKFSIATKDRSLLYNSLRDLRDKLRTPLLGTISAPFYATVYPLAPICYRRVNWLRRTSTDIRELGKPPLHPLTKHRQFTFADLALEPEDV